MSNNDLFTSNGAIYNSICDGIHQASIRKMIIIVDCGQRLNASARFGEKTYRKDHKDYEHAGYEGMGFARIAEMVLEGIRIDKEQDFSLVLFWLFVNDYCNIAHNRKYLIPLDELNLSIREYLVNTYGITCASYNSRTIPPLQIHCDIFSIVPEVEIESGCICLISKMVDDFWKSFFNECMIITFDVGNWIYKYYDDQWRNYLIINGEKYVCNIDSALTIRHERIIDICLREEHGDYIFSEGEPVYLDGNPLNISKNNLALFRSKRDANRYRHEKVEYKVDRNGIYYCPDGAVE